MEPKSEPMDKSFENKSEDLKEERSTSGQPPLDEKMDPNSAGNTMMKKEPKSEPMDRIIENKSEDLKEEGSTSGQPPLDEKEEEPHPTHSIMWTFKGEKPKLVSCNRAGTVEDSLKRNRQFKELAEKNKGRELVLLRNEKAICSHFPCSLIKGGNLTVTFINVEKKEGETAGGSAHVRRKGSSDEVVFFHVRTMGGEGVMYILKNKGLKKDVYEMTIFAYKGETVEQALRRDARFLETVFKKNCMLSDDVDVDMSNLVDDVGDKTYTIKKGSNPPATQPSNPKDSQSAGSQRPDAEEKQNPSEQSVKDNTNTSGHTAAEQTPLPTSEEMRIHLSSQFENFMNGKETVPFQVGNKTIPMTEVLRAEYGKNAQTCTEVKTMKELMGLSNSVCQVRINGRPIGSGFLLFDRFVLTNAHVVKEVYDDSEKELNAEVTVHFSYESQDPTERGQDSFAKVEVEEVAGFEYTKGVYDWALLKLSADVKLPTALLNKCGYINQSHGVCIIGHPDGGVKRIDPCLCIAPENRNQVVEKSWIKNQGNTKLITERFFEGVAVSVMNQTNVLTYQTSFYEGSSGSPVFDKDCNVLAMHSGGFTYRDKTDQIKSVIEFGYSLSDIIKRIYIQLKERKVADETFKEFFEYCQKEEPVPMDT